MNVDLGKRLAAFLQEQYADIVDDWAHLILDSLDQYQHRSFDELQATVSAHLQAIIAFLDKQDHEKLDEFIRWIAKMRTDMKFRLSETLQAFTIGKDVILDLVRQNDVIPPDEILDIIAVIETPYNYSLQKYSEIYQEFRIREIEQKNRDLILLQEREANLRMANLLYSTSNLREFIDQALALIVEVIEADGGALFFTGKGLACSGMVSFCNLPDSLIEIVQKPQNFPRHSSSATSVSLHNSPILNPENSGSPYLETIAAEKHDFSSWICFPIQADGEQIGSIELFYREKFDCKKHHEQLLDSIAKQLTVGIQKVELKQKLIHAEQLAAIGKMSAQLAHEIRNPLSSLILNVDLIRDELEQLPESSRDEALSILTSMKEELDILTDVTEGYLQFARMPHLVFSPENINDIVLGLAKLMEPEFERAGIILSLDLQENIPAVTMDRNHFSRTILNILKNSHEAVAQNGLVEIITSCDGQKTVNIIIKDNGPGIEKEFQKKIFEPFVTSKDNGSGLGLSYAHMVIEKHGGTIRVDSGKKQGIQFIITLPVNN